MKRSTYRTLFITMLAFGVLAGLLFPPFTKLALNYDKAMSLAFIAMCVAAGLAVGVVNFLLFKFLVSRELFRIVLGMRNINARAAKALYAEQGTQDAFQLEVDSDDILGEVARAFNGMSQAVADRIKLEGSIRTLMANLSNSVELKTVSSAMLEDVIRSCGAKGGLLYGDLGGDFALLAARGLDTGDDLPARLDTAHGPVAQAVKKGEVVILFPEEEGLDWVTMSTPLGRYRPGIIVLIPLVSEQHTAGVIVLACNQKQISPERRKMVEIYRSYIAPYLQNALLHRKIEEMAAVDELTGLYNRRFGMRRLQEEYSKAARGGGAISTILLDIDHFKKVNDAFGHAAGDEVLKTVASILESRIRAGEVVCRYGGEEFLVVVPGSDSLEAALLAERLRALVEAARVDWDNRLLSVTISLGVVSWPESSFADADGVVKAADEAMYFAKDSGRNKVAAHYNGQVVLHEDLPAV